MTNSRETAEPQDPRVQSALEEYLSRIDCGEQVDREQFLGRHPEIAEELRSFIVTAETLERMADVGRGADKHAVAASLSTHSVMGRNEETVMPRRAAAAGGSANTDALPEKFGRYRVIRPLGRGAMGTVFLAEDTQLHRQVALKTPSFEKDETGELLERFYREARAAATLQHPNICPVFDVGEIDGRHFISMAYLKGRPLSAYMHGRTTGAPAGTAA